MHQDVDEFADVVTQFCRCIDHRREVDAWTFVGQCARLLSSLFLLALELPDIAVESVDTLPAVLSPQASREIARDIGRKLGTYNVYWLVFDPFEPPSAPSPIAGELSDDLTDIYLELLDGLSAFRTGSEERRCEAICHWKFGFQVHWGRHLVSALRPIQAILAGHLLDESEGHR